MFWCLHLHVPFMRKAQIILKSYDPRIRMSSTSPPWCPIFLSFSQLTDLCPDNSYMILFKTTHVMVRIIIIEKIYRSLYIIYTTSLSGSSRLTFGCTQPVRMAYIYPQSKNEYKKEYDSRKWNQKFLPCITCIVAMASTAPAAPRRWPIMDFVEFTLNCRIKFHEIFN